MEEKKLVEESRLSVSATDLLAEEPSKIVNADGKSYLSEQVSVNYVKNSRDSWTVEEEKKKVNEFNFE